MSKKKEVKKLDPEMLKQITRFVIDRIREEESATAQLQRDKRRASTKLLLRNYRSLVDHCENASFTAAQVEVDDGLSLAEILEMINGKVSDRLKVESIRQSAVKTKIIINHIDTMLGLYKSCCERSPKEEDMRRYRVICGLYLDKERKTAVELAELEYTDKRTIYRDVSAAVEQLTSLFFGIDGLSLLVR